VRRPRRDTQRRGEHGGRDQGVVGRQIDQRRRFGGRASPLQLALEQMSPREPSIVVFQAALNSEANCLQLRDERAIRLARPTLLQRNLA